MIVPKLGVYFLQRTQDLLFTKKSSELFPSMYITFNSFAVSKLNWRCRHTMLQCSQCFALSVYANKLEKIINTILQIVLEILAMR